MSFQIKAVLSAAASIQREWNKQQRLALQNAVRLALPKHRAAACMRHRLGMSDVTVNATASGKTRLGGLMVCDAFHVCPLCHQRKMAADKATITELVLKHYAAGGLLVDAVLTVPHHAREPLAVVLERLETVLRIPDQAGQRFQSNLDSDSSGSWTPIPRQAGQLDGVA